MDVNSTYFILNPECYFVKGAKRGAIYNLHDGKLISTDSELSELLIACESRKPLAEAFESAGLSEKRAQAMACLENLRDMNLGRFYERPFFIEKLKPALSKQQAEIMRLPPNLNVLYLEMTNECNLNCIFCNAHSELVNRITSCKRRPTNDVEGKQLELNEWVDIMCDAAKLRCKHLQIMGGEPLLVADSITAIIQKASELGYESIRLDTNGLLLDNEKIDFFAAHRVKLMLQVFGYKREIHDAITGVEGSFEELIQNLERLKQKRAYYSFMLTLLKTNEGCQDETIQFFRSFNPIDFIVDILRPRGLEYPGLVSDKLYSRICCAGPQQLLRQKISPYLFFQRLEGHPCWDGKLAVTLRGDILPCIMARKHVIANVAEKDLRSVFRDRDMKDLWNLTKDKIEGCNMCEYRYACFDCRPIEMSGCGNPKGMRYCTYDPLKGEWGEPSAIAN